MPKGVVFKIGMLPSWISIAEKIKKIECRMEFLPDKITLGLEQLII
jgi:hypothetical protein